jgi:hypothetical protein
MKIIKVSEVLLDGGTIEEIVTDIGVFKRDNRKVYFKLAQNGGYYLHSKGCAYFDGKIEEYFKNKYNQFIPAWNTNKVIDFVNWYIDLKGLGENNKLENQSIVDSFLRGDKVEVWKQVNFPQKDLKNSC